MYICKLILKRIFTKMDRNRFAEMVRKPEVFTADDLAALRELRETNPFSSAVQVLTVLAAKSVEGESPAGEVRRAALALADAGRLDTLLAAVKPAPAPEEPFDVLREINSYKEVSFKTAPKSVILSNFLNSDDFNMPSESQNDDQTIVELGKKSISPENMSESETLAVILEKQGRYPNAIEVYKKLILKYPEKSSTFAARISNLESLINNKQ